MILTFPPKIYTFVQLLIDLGKFKQKSETTYINLIQERTKKKKQRIEYSRKFREELKYRSEKSK